MKIKKIKWIRKRNDPDYVAWAGTIPGLLNHAFFISWHSDWPCWALEDTLTRNRKFHELPSEEDCKEKAIKLLKAYVEIFVDES